MNAKVLHSFRSMPHRIIGGVPTICMAADDGSFVQSADRAAQREQASAIGADLTKLATPTLTALAADPAVNAATKQAVRKELAARGESESGVRGRRDEAKIAPEGIAASFGRSAGSRSFVDSCARRAEREQQSY